jgi:hypothetical protein
MSAFGIEVELFGGLRVFNPMGPVKVELSGAVDVATLKRLVADKLGGSESARALVEVSALATTTRVLGPAETLAHEELTGRLALLPPVNGG